MKRLEILDSVPGEDLLKCCEKGDEDNVFFLRRVSYKLNEFQCDLSEKYPGIEDDIPKLCSLVRQEIFE